MQHTLVRCGRVRQAVIRTANCNEQRRESHGQQLCSRYGRQDSLWSLWIQPYDGGCPLGLHSGEFGYERFGIQRFWAAAPDFYRAKCKPDPDA